MSTSRISSIPKIDLHCHLDGSLSTNFVAEALSIPHDEEKLLSEMRVSNNCTSLTEYLKCFDLPIKALQTYDNITNAVVDVIRQAAAENVAYIEIRFAPTFSVNDNLTYNKICEASIEGCNIGLARYGVYANIILCAMRHLDLATNMLTLNATREYLGCGIVALDLAGDESLFPNENFTELFEEANRLDVPFTIHSGECGSSRNVKLALELGARRVGHGIALINDKKLIDQCRNNRLGLELCPTSNFQTKAASSYDSYPLRDFLDLGLLATVNTDNRTVSNTHMTRELELSIDKLSLTEEDLITIYKNSVEISFADDNIKHHLLKMSSAF